MAQDAHTFDVLVEPIPQSRPCPRERLVSHFDRLAVAREQPRTDEVLDELVVRRFVRQQVAREARPSRLAAVERGHQPQQEIAQFQTLAGVDVCVERLGGLRDRTADAARFAVCSDGHRAAVPVRPGLPQRMRHQRQGTRLVEDIAHDQVDQSWFEEQRRLAGRPLDRHAQVGLGHRSEQEQTSFDEPCEVLLGRDLAESIGAERDHQWRLRGMDGEGGEERPPLRRDRRLATPPPRTGPRPTPLRPRPRKR